MLGFASSKRLQRVENELEVQRELVVGFSKKLDDFRLDYENLYEKARSNLAKLARRADRECGEEQGAGNGPQSAPDSLAAYRSTLIQKKLARRHL